MKISEQGCERKKLDLFFRVFSFYPPLTARENVMLPLELSGRKDAGDVANRLLGEVGLAGRSRSLSHHVIGWRARSGFAIARAFVSEPKILFADEPTGNLDTRTGERIIDLLFRLNAGAGTTLVLVTHDERLARRCDVRFAMDAGELRSLGA